MRQVSILLGEKTTVQHDAFGEWVSVTETGSECAAALSGPLATAYPDKKPWDAVRTAIAKK